MCIYANVFILLLISFSFEDRLSCSLMIDLYNSSLCAELTGENCGGCGAEGNDKSVALLNLFEIAIHDTVTINNTMILV